MGYLDRLKSLDSGNCAPCVLPKVPKPPYDSNGSTHGERFLKSTSEVGAGDTAYTWWLIHYADREPVEMSCSPPATRAEVMGSYPAALAAEPFEPIPRTPGAPMTRPEERAVRAWLARIEESDQATIAAVMTVCRADADARDYYLRRAAE